MQAGKQRCVAVQGGAAASAATCFASALPPTATMCGKAGLCREDIVQARHERPE